jgi:hypothetical protein
MRYPEHYVSSVETDGVAVIEGCVDDGFMRQLSQAITHVAQETDGRAVLRRGGEVYGIRNLLDFFDVVQPVMRHPAMRRLVEPILGAGASAVRALFFDKMGPANWSVAWHQDLAIAVQCRAAASSFGPWSVKAGVDHCHAPASVLEKMLTVRLHLDDATNRTGALQVYRGSHRHGRLSPEDIERWKAAHVLHECETPAGGAVVMRPLLLHASAAAIEGEHRRVLHFELAAESLPPPLAWKWTEALFDSHGGLTKAT